MSPEVIILPATEIKVEVVQNGCTQEITVAPSNSAQVEVNVNAQTETDPWWFADKPNYYTKSEVDGLLGTLVVTAGMPLSSGRVVYISAGKAYYYDPTDMTLAGKTLGITKTAALINTDVVVQTEGIYIQAGLGLTADETYFVGANGALVLSTTGLRIIQAVGVSISADDLAIHFYSPIITN